MNIYHELRKQILSGDLEKTFNLLEEIAPLRTVDDILLIHFQYNEWKKHNPFPPYSDKNERNRIVYALLTLISENEIEKDPRKQANTLKTMHVCELELAKRYEVMVQLEKDTMVDLFLLWFQQHYPTLFDQIILVAKRKRQLIDFESIFQVVDLKEFIKQNSRKIAIIVNDPDFNLPTSYLSSFLLDKLNGSDFLLGWLEYREQKNLDTASQSNAIKQLLKRHQTLIIGLAGGILGALAYQFFQNLLEDLDFHDDADDDADDDD